MRLYRTTHLRLLEATEMLLHTEYYSFPGAVDELRVWHVATGPSLGCEMDYST